METNEYPTEFVIWFKTNDGYRMTAIQPPEENNNLFFESLSLRLVVELENIKKDIIAIIASTDKYEIIHPKSIEKDKQDILNMLVKMRKENIKTNHIIKNLMNDKEHIICEFCKSKMYRKPVNVSYTKYGKSILITEKELQNDIKYIFDCSNPDCHRCVKEETYYEELRNIQLRNELLSKGETFVPSKFGYWNRVKT